MGAQAWLVAAVNAIVRGTAIRTVDKMVLVVLASHCNGAGHCRLYQRTIAAEASITDRNVRLSLSRLSALGLVRVTSRIASHGGRVSSDFAVCVPAALAVTPPDRRSGGVDQRSGGQDRRSPPPDLGSEAPDRRSPPPDPRSGQRRISLKEASEGSLSEPSIHPKTRVTGHQAAPGGEPTDGWSEVELVEEIRRIWPQLDPRAIVRRLDRFRAIGSPKDVLRYLRACREDATLKTGTSHPFFAACASHRIEAWHAKRLRKAPSSPPPEMAEPPPSSAQIAVMAEKIARAR
jgi:hypothetical protein